MRFAAACSLLFVLAGCMPAIIPEPQALDEVERRTVTTIGKDGKRRELSYLISTTSIASTTASVGTRVIFVHGTPGSATNFAGYLQDPLPGTEIVSVDRIGFGQSSRGPSRFGALTEFEQQADAIAPLLHSSDGRPVVLVGHSLGGPIVCDLAARYPDLIAGIVVLAGSVDPALEYRYWYNYAGLLSPGLLIDRQLLRANIEVFAARRETRRLAGLLDQITCPVMVVHGLDDSLVPFENVVYLAENLPNAETIEVIGLRGEGHFLPWTRREVILQSIERLLFLTRQE